MIGVSGFVRREYVCTSSLLSLLNCLKTCYFMDIVSSDWGGYARVVMSLTGMRDVCLRIAVSKEAANDLFALY